MLSDLLTSEDAAVFTHGTTASMFYIRFTSFQSLLLWIYLSLNVLCSLVGVIAWQFLKALKVSKVVCRELQGVRITPCLLE